MLLGGRVTLVQPRHGFRAAIDPVLLAAAVAPRPGEVVLDLGCGSGAAALCLAARLGNVSVIGLDLQQDLVAMARAGATASGLGQVRFAAGDLRDVPAELAGQGIDHIMTNPPFLAPGTGTMPLGRSRALATTEGHLDLDGWIGAALHLLRPHGTITVIHRADRIEALLAAMAGKVGALSILPLWPHADAPARRVIVAGRRGAKRPTRLLPGLVLHEQSGKYTAAAEAVLRHAAALTLA